MIIHCIRVCYLYANVSACQLCELNTASIVHVPQTHLPVRSKSCCHTLMYFEELPHTQKPNLF